MGKGSDRWLSPQGPYTGDGRTRRDMYDKPTPRASKQGTPNIFWRVVKAVAPKKKP